MITQMIIAEVGNRMWLLQIRARSGPRARKPRCRVLNVAELGTIRAAPSRLVAMRARRVQRVGRRPDSPGNPGASNLGLAVLLYLNLVEDQLRCPHFRACG